MPRAQTICNLPRLLLTCALGVAAVLWTTAVWADHSLGNACIGCHMLRSTAVQLGTRNISADRLNYPLYKNYWYCGTGSPQEYGGGQPLDCSYCHDGDIGLEIGGDGGGTAAGASSAHPVDVLGPTASYGANRIQCNDCHNADVSPLSLCEKVATDGYPNHRNLSGITEGPGTNLRTGAAAHLQMEYGPTAGNNWTTTNNILCFKCHEVIKQQYDSPTGGHSRTLPKKLPCYNCHDPHAATYYPGPPAIEGNKALIINGLVTPANPYKTSYEDFAPPRGYDGSNDYLVCYGCHRGYTVEGVDLGDVLTAAFSPRFPFHANAHDGLTETSNCLQNQGGCHQGAHKTDVYRCLDCHSTAKSLATAHPKLRNPADPGFVGHVDAAFAGIGGVTEANIRSQHDISYTDQPGDDMSLAANNGCLSCHGVLATDTLTGGRVPFLKAGGTAYGRTRPLSGAWSNREALNAYDPFCLSCHSGTYPSFGSFPAPNVGRYFASAGHGRTTSFSLPSSNGAPKIPCLECHLYHGSSAYKLLPGDSLVGQARVVKGFAYAPQTTGTVFPIGDNTDSRKIDYTDYTDKGGSPDSPTWYNSRLSGRTSNDLRSGYLSNYTVNWSTNRGDTPRNPAGIWTPFGTSGDVRENTQNSNRSLDCNQDATNARNTTTPKIGFCNACHFYNNSTDGTASAYGRIYTHEGDLGGTDCAGTPTGDKLAFFKDCAECHDPHGSGSSTDANFFMIRGKIKHGKTEDLTDAVNSSNWTEVNFYVSGADPVPPYDPNKTSNSEHLCNVCHSGLLWSNLNPAQDTADHALGQRCTQCHPHSE